MAAAGAALVGEYRLSELKPEQLSAMQADVLVVNLERVLDKKAGLLDMLREEFQMPVDELDPFRRITYNPAKFSDEYIQEIAPRLSVCVGLGLRSFDEA